MVRYPWVIAFGIAALTGVAVLSSSPADPSAPPVEPASPVSPAGFVEVVEVESSNAPAGCFAARFDHSIALRVGSRIEVEGRWIEVEGPEDYDGHVFGPVVYLRGGRPSEARAPFRVDY